MKWSCEGANVKNRNSDDTVLDFFYLRVSESLSRLVGSVLDIVHFIVAKCRDEVTNLKKSEYR